MTLKLNMSVLSLWLFEEIGYFSVFIIVIGDISGSDKP